MRETAQVPDAVLTEPSISGSFVKLIIAVLGMNLVMIADVGEVSIVTKVGIITTLMKNVQRRIRVKVIVIFIPVFVLIQAVLWEENIKSAVNQTAAAVPV